MNVLSHHVSRESIFMAMPSFSMMLPDQTCSAARKRIECLQLHISDYVRGQNLPRILLL